MSVERSALNVERSGVAGRIEPSSSSPNDAARPWLGLASFTEETRAVFYGRDDEVAELARRVQRKLLTVLFGQSGLGKTSILRAGLVPKLRPDGFCPIYVRLDHSAEGLSPNEQIKQAVRRASEGLGTWSRPDSARDGESLWEFFHHRDDVLTSPEGRVLTPLLIFDQFEEIFTLAQTDDAGRARALAFLREFADLIENRAPAAIEDNEAAAERFDFARAEYRLLIALREDYLAHLEGLRDLMPSVTQNRVRLTRMAGGPALEAILRPGAGVVNDEVARQIVRFVSGARDLTTAEVEPSLLSLVCRELNEVRLARGAPEISADLLEGSRDTILGEFYERTLADQPAAVRTFVEDVLLTDSGYRESVAEERVQKAFADAGAPGALTALVDRRLLRIEERLDVRRVELTHDVLCSVVKASRGTRQEREAKERAERELVMTRAQEAATRRAMWRARILGLGAAILCVFAAASAYFGYRNMVRAREQERVARTIAYSSGMMVARQVLDDSNLGGTKTILDRQRPHSGEPDYRGWEWRYLWGQTRSDAESILYQDGPGGEISSVAISPDGRLAAIGTYHAGGVVVIDLETRKPIATVAPERRGVLSAFSPTEPLLAFTSVDADVSSAQVQLWNTQTREPVRTWPLDLPCNGLAFSADGRMLITTEVSSRLGSGSLAIWNVADGSKAAGFSAPLAHMTVGIAFTVTADLRSAAFVSEIGGREFRALTVVDLPSGAVRWTAPVEQAWGTAMTFSPDGSILATAEGYGQTDIRLWDVASGQLLGRLHGHESWVGQIVFWPDGSKLATAGADQTIRTWDVASRTTLDVLRGHENEVWRLALLPDNYTLVSGSKDGVVAFWDTAKLHPRPTRIDWPKPMDEASWSADSQTVVTVDRAGRVERWSGGALEKVEHVLDLSNPGSSGYFSHDGTILVEREPENSLVVWDVSAAKIKGRISQSLPGAFVDQVLGRRNTVVVFQPGGYSEVQEIELDSGKVVASWPDQSSIGAVPYSDDERFSVALMQEGGLRIRDHDAQTMRDVAADYLEPSGGAISPDGTLFAVSSRIGYVRVWDTATWQEVVTLRGFILGAAGVAFSPDGKRLAATDGSGKQAVRLWDTASWQEVLTLRAPGSVFNDPRFSPDGNRIWASSNDSILHVWTAPSWEEIVRAERGTSNAER